MGFQDEETFKVCTCCGQVWPTREGFLSDGNIRLRGYQASFKDPAEGLLLFIHMKEGCGTSIAVKAKSFRDIYTGHVYPDSARGSEKCPGYCLGEFNLERCDANCKYAYVRELLQIINQRTKNKGARKL